MTGFLHSAFCILHFTVTGRKRPSTRFFPDAPKVPSAFNGVTNA